MKPNEIISRMIAPGVERPSIWRKGVLQIWVTRACDKSCFACTQGSNLGGKPGMISLEQFEQACQSLEGYFGVVGIFGGNPVLHPKFEQICEIYTKYFPYEQRGIWCNHPKGKGRLLREVFNPAVSNLNVHLDREAYDEFCRDWPESKAVVKGLEGDSRHSSPFVALKDVIEDEQKRWELIAGCDINRYWSAMVCVVKGRVKGYFCEIAGSQAMLHESDPNYPDYGVDATPGWWRRPIEEFAEQISFYCHRCGIPLRAKGELAITGKNEYVSQTHQLIYKPKIQKRNVVAVSSIDVVGANYLSKATDYIENGKILTE